MQERTTLGIVLMDANVTPHDLWQFWNFDLSIAIPLVLTALMYVWGTYNIWQRAGKAHGIRRRHYSSFLGAMLALIIAFVSPLYALSEVLFSAHMVQHMILLLVAAPLLVMSEFPLAFLWALPRDTAQGIGSRWNQSRILSWIWQALQSPISAWVLFTIAFWIWHTLFLYEAALQNETVHILEHVIFLGT